MFRWTTKNSSPGFMLNSTERLASQSYMAVTFFLVPRLGGTGGARRLSAVLPARDAEDVEWVDAGRPGSRDVRGCWPTLPTRSAGTRPSAVPARMRCQPFSTVRGEVSQLKENKEWRVNRPSGVIMVTLQP